MKNTPEVHKALREIPEEAAKLKAELRQAQQELGIEQIITCDCLWANEEFLSFGIEKYPDMEALEKNIQIERSLGWFEYIQAFTLLGVESDG